MLTTSVTEAAQYLTQGDVLAYPTEAVWGLGCDPFNEQAFHEILRLKQRPIEKGVILLAGDISQVEHLLDELDPDIRRKLFKVGHSAASMSAPRHGYCRSIHSKFPLGLQVNIIRWLFGCLITHFVWHCVMPLAALLSRPVPIRQDLNLRAHYRKLPPILGSNYII